MIPWSQRSSEERALLSPCFCSIILWHAAVGYTAQDGENLSFEEAFLILPLVLHAGLRSSLPRDTRTSLPVWLSRYPLAPATIADRARSLAPFVKEGILFGSNYGVLELSHGRLQANEDIGGQVRSYLGRSSGEVQTCARRAGFVGRWFAHTGNAVTVFATLGVRP